MVPSVDTKPATIRKFLVALVTRMPCCCTSSGSSGWATASLFCTCTCAVSGLVPCENVSVIDMLPSELLSDEMYCRLSMPFICCSMTCTTVSCTV
ncbi:Uncharacterised protein [Bordetella pertussis]|nr:Uncharacterised protein [Bordetella pertussis]CFO72356.1 Uncharacterised protein [Bordetella pertussis]CFP25664.1 Uncharacterised protein [Bordetella pertussis]CFT97451.1 Uncharacterised protein [Bordetella pertussis]CFU48538.1 Uncharacterised protein [Bordetella pertussis]